MELESICREQESIGENQIYCIAQVQIWLSWPSWPSPDLHPTWTWTWAWQQTCTCWFRKNSIRGNCLRSSVHSGQVMLRDTEHEVRDESEIFALNEWSDSWQRKLPDCSALCFRMKMVVQSIFSKPGCLDIYCQADIWTILVLSFNIYSNQKVTLSKRQKVCLDTYILVSIRNELAMEMSRKILIMCSYCLIPQF